ncbi:MBL fold metallo-hydrolase [Patescibacteria group bacterium]|nr:MBL fold metallo-hydrolase [Patescibacteria group bacterium]
MIINWYGEGCFKIQTGGITILTDPFEASTGLTPARGKNEIVIRTLTGWPMKDEDMEGTIIRGAGEYEAQKVLISGFPLQAESTDTFFKTAYKVTAEDITIGLCGHLSEGLSQEAAEKLNDVDILVMPAGGKPFIAPETATKLIKQLSPKIVLASFFKTPGLKRSSADWKALADEMDQKPEVLDKLTVRKKDLTEQKGTKLVVVTV